MKCHQPNICVVYMPQQRMFTEEIFLQARVDWLGAIAFDVLFPLAQAAVWKERAAIPAIEDSVYCACTETTV